jgi:peptide/nickel transport system substrate-binding protein
MAVSIILAACSPAGTPTPTPTTIVKTVVVTEKVEVSETPQVVEKVITATPPPAATEAPLKPVSPEFKNPDTYMVIDGAGEPQTLDPAWTHELVGGAIETNIYEGLVWYNRDKHDEFIPALATEWTTSEDGLTWTFTIRKGVTFHEGGTLEPHDVAYTLWRSMLQGRMGGAQYMAYEGFFGPAMVWSSIKDFSTAYLGKETFEELTPADLVKVCEAIKARIVADDEAGTVTFNLAQPIPWMLPATTNIYMGLILDQEWMAEQGDWNGECDTWQDFADPSAQDTLLFERANGTGPYKLDHWTPGEETALVANENYWRTEPMWEGGPSGAPQIKRVVIKNITDWSTRLAMFEAGDADWIYALEQYRSQLYPSAKEYCSKDGTTCEEANPQGYIRVLKDLLTPSITPAQFNWQMNVEGGNPYIGSGKLDGSGTLPDFFQDIHVRRAFNYCFDFQAMIDGALFGEGIQTQGPIPKGMLGYREGEAPLFSYDPARCE